MKSFTLKASSVLISIVMAAGISASAEKMAMIVASDDISSLNSQEKTAAQYFQQNFPDGEIIAVNDIDRILDGGYGVVWVHIDRCNIQKGWRNLPDGFGSDDVADALGLYLEDGGSLYLSKHATQLTVAINRLPEAYAPGIFGAADGGNGTDVWTIQPRIGVMNMEADPTQYYDHSSHPIYKGLATLPAGHEYANFATETYPMEGTGDGTVMWREDHNCMWDLNAYQYTSPGKNTTEMFEKDFSATVLGTWGHVLDYCVAGIVEFHPVDTKGAVIANGLAACEWAPRNSGNAYHSNLEKLTGNTINYLASLSGASSTDIMSADEVGANDAEAEYFNLQGVRVAASELAPGIYVVRKGSDVTKRIIR